ncbi:hypothetical protein E2C01_102435 [Portunus trituberculatus]|uniref:Uncharacterized protein n=1 Tax=Portunus trituberculatus TaxID=210409 RepID=A0A5B7KID2_PORTR|nr:hypothetical protein [Portunus trituberculatus]
MWLACSVFSRHYISASLYTHTEVSRRRPPPMSSTTPELYAVLEARRSTLWRLSITMFISLLSQAALYALQSTSPPPPWTNLVDKCVNLIHALEGAGATVHFTWTLSCGCPAK